MFKGIFTALITPFQADGAVDEKSLKNLVNHQIASGIHGVIPMGTTGESATLPDDEHCETVTMVVRQVNGKIPVIAGCGSNDTQHFVHLAKKIEKIGVDALLAVTPYYNKPNCEGLYQHYRALARTTTLPIILYNVPARTGINMSIEVIVRLAKDFKNIVAIKDAVPSEITRTLAIQRRVDKDFQILSGEDSTFAAGLALGMSGCVSVTSNIVPHLVVQLYQAWIDNNRNDFIRLSRLIYPLNEALFIHPNPVPAKAAAKLLGLIANDAPRLPLTTMPENGYVKIREALQQVGAL